LHICDILNYGRREKEEIRREEEEGEVCEMVDVKMGIKYASEATLKAHNGEVIIHLQENINDLELPNALFILPIDEDVAYILSLDDFVASVLHSIINSPHRKYIYDIVWHWRRLSLYNLPVRKNVYDLAVLRQWIENYEESRTYRNLADEIHQHCIYGKAEEIANYINNWKEWIRKNDEILVSMEKADMPAVWGCVLLNRTGIRIDRNKGWEICREMQRDKQRWEIMIRQYLQEKIGKNVVEIDGQRYFILLPEEDAQMLDLNSRKVMNKLLSEIYNLINVNKQTLEKIDPQLSELLHNYRAANFRITHLNFLNTNPEIDRIYPYYDILSSRTGRFSCESPNIQGFAEEWRNLFIPSEGMLFFEFDYAQIDLRVLGHYVDDVQYRDMITSSDMHRKCASLIFNKPEEEISDEERKKAKTILFGTLYGMGIKTLAHRLNISQKEAEVLYTRLRESFRAIVDYENKVNEVLRKEELSLPSITGKRRKINNSENENILMRQAINTPIQMSSADICKWTFAWLPDILDEVGGRIVAQIHDAYLLEIPEDTDLRALYHEIAENVKNCDLLEIPLKIDVRYGKRWGELRNGKELEREIKKLVNGTNIVKERQDNPRVVILYSSKYMTEDEVKVIRDRYLSDIETLIMDIAPIVSVWEEEMNDDSIDKDIQDYLLEYLHNIPAPIFLLADKGAHAFIFQDIDDEEDKPLLTQEWWHWKLDDGGLTNSLIVSAYSDKNMWEFVSKIAREEMFMKLLELMKNANRDILSTQTLAERNYVRDYYCRQVGEMN